jgi:hypothetical protein
VARSVGLAGLGATRFRGWGARADWRPMMLAQEISPRRNRRSSSRRFRRERHSQSVPASSPFSFWRNRRSQLWRHRCPCGSAVFILHSTLAPVAAPGLASAFAIRSPNTADWGPVAQPDRAPLRWRAASDLDPKGLTGTKRRRLSAGVGSRSAIRLAVIARGTSPSRLLRRKGLDSLGHRNVEIFPSLISAAPVAVSSSKTRRVAPTVA